MSRGAQILIDRDVFELIFTPQPIIDEDDGETCAARIDCEARQIVVSDRVPEHLRPQTVALVVNEAWLRKVNNRA